MERKQAVLENQVSHYRNSANNANQRVRGSIKIGQSEQKKGSGCTIFSRCFSLSYYLFRWIILLGEINYDRTAKI